MSLTASRRKAIVRKLAERDGLRCHYCGIDLSPAARNDFSPDGTTLDHITPVHLGGGSGIDNLVLACRACNRQKSTKHYQEFRFAVETDGILAFLMGGES